MKLQEAGEHICRCLRDGDRVTPYFGQEAGEKIVRCRDCEHYKPNTYSHFTCELLTFHVQPNNFCSWGERRDA